MRIKTLQVDHYGQFNNKKLEFSDTPFTVIYGPNEAGKSTLMSFIKSMLFGFPTRQKLLSYAKAPQLSQLGGRLHLDTEQYGHVSIERHYTERHVPTVYSGSGSNNQTHQELLYDLIKGLDQTLFEAIFCFDLNGLQGLENINNQELNHYLFSTGMMGSSKIYQLEKKLEKLKGDLFKPSGRKPLMNQTLDKLEKLNQDKRHGIEMNQKYIQFGNALVSNEKELNQTRQEREELIRKQEQFKKYHTLKPLLLEFSTLDNRIKDLKVLETFPEDAVVRLENWQAQLISLKSDLKEIQSEISKSEELIGKIAINENLLNQSMALEGLLKESPYIAKLMNETENLEESLNTLTQQISRNLSELGSGMEERQLLQTDTSLATKEKLKKLLSSFEELRQEKRETERMLNETNKRRRDIKSRIEIEEKKILDTFERQKLVDDLEYDKDYEKRHLKLENLKEIAKDNREQMEKSQKMGNRLFLFSIILGLIVFALFSLSHQLIFGVVGGLLISVLGMMARLMFLKIMSKDQTKINSDIKQLSETLERQGSSTDIAQVNERLKQDDLARMVVNQLQSDEEEEQNHYRTYTLKLNQLEDEELILERRYKECLEEVGLPESISPNILIEIVDLVEKTKELIRNKEQLEKKLFKTTQDIQGYQEAYESCLASSKVEPSLSEAKIETMLKVEKDKKIQKEQAKQQLKEKKDQAEKLGWRMNEIQQEINKLYEQAEADSEDELRNKSRLKVEYHTILAKYHSIDDQINFIVKNEKERQFYHDLVQKHEWDDHHSEDLNDSIDTLKKQEASLLQIIADTKAQMKQIEESGNDSSILHIMESERSSFNLLAKKWAVYHTASELLQMAKENYRNDRLPRLLNEAKHYFYKITKEKYINIFIHEESFAVTAYSGETFKVHELSRGTVEQLYLALRLALAKIFEAPTKYPLIIDDSFVNFDQMRLHSVLDLLKELSLERQILLFTCHENYYHYGDQFEIVSL